MKLSQVFEGVVLAGELPPHTADLDISGLAYDSRKVQPGMLFFAFPGAKADGRQFAAQAVEKGAVAVAAVGDAPLDFPVPWIELKHGRQALAVAAGNFFSHPDRRLKITGITGTNGKTTTSYLLDSVFRHHGFITALIGTIEYRMAGRPMPSVNTTPESLDLFQLLVELDALGGTHVTMEASSHALALGRVHAIEFDTAIFTNLTRDHLDFHQTMEAYLAAKQSLFNSSVIQGPKHAAINFDDPAAKSIQFKPNTEVIWYGLEKGAEAQAVGVANTFQGLRFDIQFRGQSHGIESPLIGKINVYNILAAWCAAFAQGIEPALIAQGIRQCSAIPGDSNAWKRGSPSWSSWTTRIPTMPCETQSP
ncbi:MAG: UDP-N-acetylmuramoyl-L-alanyl-D-glutamate--2,6-diaminopimelate ligase [Bryobacteraceae bacterium]